MDPNEITSNPSEMKASMGVEDLKVLEQKDAERRWEAYKRQLEMTLIDLPIETKNAQLQLAYNRWHGIRSSKDLLALANKDEPKVGEVFNGSYGNENIK